MRSKVIDEVLIGLTGLAAPASTPETHMLQYHCTDTAKDTAYHEAGHVVAGMGVG